MMMMEMEKKKRKKYTAAANRLLDEAQAKETEI